MLNQNQIIQLIENGENSFVEFKLDSLDNKKLARELVAFANHRGGYLLLGVSDAGKINGLSRDDNEARIMNLCADLITPPLAVSYQEMSINNKKVAVVEIETGHNKPYAVNETAKIAERKKNISVYFQRYGSTTREIKNRDEIQRLFQASQNIHYEIISVAGAKTPDIDFHAVSEYMQNYRAIDLQEFDEQSTYRFLQNLSLLSETESTLRPTIAGMLLFGKNKVTKWLPQCGIDCVKIHGRDFSNDKEDIKFFDRNVFSNLEDTFSFINRYNTHSFTVKKVRRIDSFDYPEKAIREALVNAVVHRDYTITGSRIRVHVFDDRISIRSPGGVPNTLTIEKIKLGLIYHRNPVLMQFFYDAHLSERLGQGIPIIFKQMQVNGNPEPLLEDLEDEFCLTLYKKEKHEPQLK